MAEKTVYSEGDVIITTSRVTIRGDNYFVNQIAQSRVRHTDEIDAKKDFLRKLAIAGSVIAGVVVAIAAESFAAGLALAVAGIIAALVFIKPGFKLYHVFLGMSSGEAKAFSSRNLGIAQRISNAITEALAARA